MDARLCCIAAWKSTGSRSPDGNNTPGEAQVASCGRRNSPARPRHSPGSPQRRERSPGQNFKRLTPERVLDTLPHAAQNQMLILSSVYFTVCCLIRVDVLSFASTVASKSSSPRPERKPAETFQLREPGGLTSCEVAEQGFRLPCPGNHHE